MWHDSHATLTCLPVSGKPVLKWSNALDGAGAAWLLMIPVTINRMQNMVIFNS